MIVDPLTATAAELQAELTKQNLTSTKLIKVYLEQIKNYNGYLKAVIATAPVDILERRASELDEERLSGKIRGPLHGIPILIKVNATLVAKTSFSSFFHRIIFLQSQSWAYPPLAGAWRLLDQSHDAMRRSLIRYYTYLRVQNLPRIFLSVPSL
jgi:hypothetical protein